MLNTKTEYLNLFFSFLQYHWFFTEEGNEDPVVGTDSTAITLFSSSFQSSPI